MKKLLICALALSGYAVSAQAADLSSLKDPLPDTISYAGVTFYGTIDVGYAAQDHGAAISGVWGNGLYWNVNKNSLNHVSTIANNALSTSTVGVKVEEGIGGGWAAIANLATGFNPISGELANGNRALLISKGGGSLIAASDSGRNGQFLNDVAYGGVTNPAYGTLTIGRHSNLERDAIGEYDPGMRSVAFSFLGAGSGYQGQGIREASFVDNSVKYSYQMGPLHAAALYSAGGADTGQGGVWNADIGASWKGFSVDATYGQVRNGVTTGADTTTALAGTLQDTTGWAIQGKYQFNIGGLGGLKDGGEGHKTIVYAGYENIRFGSGEVGGYIPDAAAGGYTFTAGKLGVLNYTQDMVQQVFWTGAKFYVTPELSLSGAYYHIEQSAYEYQNMGAGYAATPWYKQAGGTTDEVSFVADYQFNKHFDIYAGGNYSQVSGGMARAANGGATIAGAADTAYTHTNEYTFATGLRIKF